MDKLIAALFILLLFFIPLLMKVTVADEQITEQAEAKEIVYIMVDGEEEPIPLEEYVMGVVAGEMPMTFHDEALKAQAIAARTYALRLTDRGKKPIAATVAAQVYKTKAERKDRWGKEFKQNERRLRDIVAATEGQVILYEGEMITAMFFSTSNGKTETSENYSGAEIPYLQSVESPDADAEAAVIERTVELTLSEWNEALGQPWTADHFRSLQLVRNQTGRVQKAVTAGFEKTGRDMRDALGIASTDFNIAFDITNQIVIVTTKGYGHGVGMSQFGAEALAQKGWTANQIVTYYYAGTVVEEFTGEDSARLE